MFPCCPLGGPDGARAQPGQMLPGKGQDLLGRPSGDRQEPSPQELARAAPPTTSDPRPLETSQMDQPSCLCRKQFVTRGCQQAAVDAFLGVPGRATQSRSPEHSEVNAHPAPAAANHLGF